MLKLLRKNQKGFTLIEVMLVVIIIGIIAIIALPKLLVTREIARKGACQSNMQALRTAGEQAKWDAGAYPVDLAALLASSYISGNSAISGVCPTDGTSAYSYVVTADDPLTAADDSQLDIECTSAEAASHNAP